MVDLLDDSDVEAETHSVQKDNLNNICDDKAALSFPLRWCLVREAEAENNLTK